MRSGTHYPLWQPGFVKLPSSSRIMGEWEGRRAPIWKLTSSRTCCSLSLWARSFVLYLIPTFPFILRDASIKLVIECGFCFLKLLCCFVLYNDCSVLPGWYQLGTCLVSCITLRIFKRFWKYNLQVR